MSTDADAARWAALWAVLGELGRMRTIPAELPRGRSRRRIVARIDAEVDGVPVALSFRAEATLRDRRIVNLRATVGTS